MDPQTSWGTLMSAIENGSQDSHRQASHPVVLCSGIEYTLGPGVLLKVFLRGKLYSFEESQSSVPRVVSGNLSKALQ